MAHNARYDSLYKSPQDRRDYSVTQLVMRAAPIPDEVKTSQYCGATYDQGDFGFCWAHMVAAILNNFLNRYAPGVKYRFSPLYIAQAVKRFGLSDYPAQEGDSIRAAVKGIQKLGAVAESMYPYGEYASPLIFPEIDELLQRIAQRYVGGVYAKLETVEDMLVALSDDNALAIGVIWTSQAITNHWLGMPNGTIRGGHAIAGFDFSKTLTKDGHQGWIKFQNSHGEDWGEKGFGYISFDYLRAVSDFAFPFLIDCFGVAPAVLQYMQAAVLQEYTDDSSTAFIDGMPMELDQAAFIVPETGRMVVPMRAFGNQAGYQVDYNAATKTAKYILR